MSRLYTRTSRGRQPLLSTPKIVRSKEHADDTYQEPSNKRQRTTRSHATTVQQAKRTRAASTASDSSSGDLDGEDASDEDSPSEDDEEPAVTAPSRETLVREVGPFDNASLAGSVDSMFGDHNGYYNTNNDPDLSPDENLKRFEDQIFTNSDDDDDEAYRGVDEISDSDDDDVDRYEEQQLIAALSDDDIPDEEFYLNQIDGLSAYGFGDESDGTVPFPPSSRGSDTGVVPEAMHERHVRFDMESAHTFQLQLSSSPTISRALLPSALPDNGNVFGGPASAPIEAHHETTSEDSYDSDATDDCLPEEALHDTGAGARKMEAESASVQCASLPPKPSKKDPQRKGPPRGVFIDEGDKASGILDPTGKILLITHPNLLGEEFAKRYGDSLSNSPSIGFEELIEESEAGDAQQNKVLAPAAGTDIMLASLNSSITDPANFGQATGPQEAFYPAPGFQLGDYALDADAFDDDFEGAELGEDVINMDDVIKFDDDSDDSDEPTSPIFMPPMKDLPGFGNVTNEFSHLTNDNVTAFRNNADPSYTTFSNAASFANFPEFATPARPRKRKTPNSPYTSSHYNGVTPVQRMKDPKPPSTPDSISPRKRRRLMTA